MARRDLLPQPIHRVCSPLYLATDDFTTVSVMNQLGEYTWPIEDMTYVYVRAESSFLVLQEQALLKAFLQALYDDSFVQDCVEDYGLV